MVGGGTFSIIFLQKVHGSFGLLKGIPVFIGAKNKSHANAE